MSFRIQGLKPALFSNLFGLNDDALKANGAIRHIVTSNPSAPCRITLDDAEIGETVLLLSHRHLDVASPYAQSGPIFVREIAETAFDACDFAPPALTSRLLSIRAFDADDMMIDAEVIDGDSLPESIARFWTNPRVAYAQAHFAKRGCFAATITRH
jgi:hypothetical protein